MKRRKRRAKQRQNHSAHIYFMLCLGCFKIRTYASVSIFVAMFFSFSLNSWFANNFYFILQPPKKLKWSLYWAILFQNRLIFVYRIEMRLYLMCVYVVEFVRSCIYARYNFKCLKTYFAYAHMMYCRKTDLFFCCWLDWDFSSNNHFFVTLRSPFEIHDFFFFSLSTASSFDFFFPELK